MAGKGKGGNTVAAVWSIAEPIAHSLGLILWDVRFVKEGASWYLRVFIDKPGGVGIDDCVDMSHALDKPLDDADPIEQSYCLEVSSPGIERELTRQEHFDAMLGRSVKVRLIRPLDGVREFTGVLGDFDQGSFTLKTGDEAGMCITLRETSWVRLIDDGSETEVENTEEENITERFDGKNEQR